VVEGQKSPEGRGGEAERRRPPPDSHGGDVGDQHDLPLQAREVYHVAFDVGDRGELVERPGGGRREGGGGG
jgi:hypothetical protein